MTEVLRPNREHAQRVEIPKMFDGDVAAQRAPGADHDLEIAAVFFEDGARTLPHVHTTDQILVGVEGRCVIVDEDGEVQIGVGDTAIVTRGRWHWHGAAEGTVGAHLTVRIPGPTDWNPPSPGGATA